MNEGCLDGEDGCCCDKPRGCCPACEPCRKVRSQALERTEPMTSFEEELFRCQGGLHALKPDDPLDPAGTSCLCGAISLIGVLALAKQDRKVFCSYLLDTNPPEEIDA